MRYIFTLLFIFSCSIISHAQNEINLLKITTNDLDKLGLKEKVASVIQTHHTFGELNDAIVISPVTNNVKDNTRMYFNKKGNTTRLAYFDALDSLQGETSYSYENGLLKKTVTIMKMAQSARTIHYNYNKKGQLIQETSFVNEKDTANILQMIYNEKGHVLNMKNEDRVYAGEYGFAVTYVYDYKKRLVSFTNFDAAGIPTLAGEYQFNEALALTKSIIRFENQSGITTINYTTDGTITTPISVNAAGAQTKGTPIITAFKYDTKGNWIEKREWKEGATKGQLWKRTLTYH